MFQINISGLEGLLKTIITGAAGFIGMACALRLLNHGVEVVGIDNLNDYYDVSLKQKRLSILQKNPKFSFYNIDISNREALRETFGLESPERVLHLAAQAGVRYSLTNPDLYIDYNIQGFINILEICRHRRINHLVYASSSSVYGGNVSMPFSERDIVSHPISLYAATKKSNELMAHAYSHLFNLPTSGLRYFTVYGPWGRPDMALFLFADAMLKGEPINVFNNGEMIRDFTYIDDVVECTIRILDKPATPDVDFNSSAPDPSTSHAPYRVFNIGNGNPTPLIHYIDALEDALGLKAKKILLPMQAGDVPVTSADTTKLWEWIGFQPNTKISDGVHRFAEWYLEYYQHKS
jgi:UDP-glucuronate 4-epimerase